MTLRQLAVSGFLLALAVTSSEAQTNPPKRGPGGTRTSNFITAVPAQAGNVVLARPTNTSVGASLLFHEDHDAVLVWGNDSSALPATGKAVNLKSDSPQLVTMDNLTPDTQYFYELRSAATGERLLPLSGPGTFRTARPASHGFTFTVTADSHLDDHTSPEVYAATLENARNDRPDFHIDLGDTFMTEKHESRDSAFGQYQAQRYYFGSLCHSAPLFLVLGNHDGESLNNRSGALELALWSNATRKLMFPNPVPNDFYTGNDVPHAQAGFLEDYYAWEWGDALFIVLDPFWFSSGDRGQRDNWRRTLGSEQYHWLEGTLQQSKARFKFVFIHHLVGGASPQCRGGAEAVPFYEWGGKNQDGSEGLALHRPGWPKPIHQLLVENHVNIVFHGHDHLYAMQDVDGIVYQEVPQPGDPRGSTRSAAEYGYIGGTILASSGHVRVAVSPDATKVEYIRADNFSGPFVHLAARRPVMHTVGSPPRQVREFAAVKRVGDGGREGFERGCGTFGRQAAFFQFRDADSMFFEKRGQIL